MGCSAVGCLKKLLIVVNFVFIVIGIGLIGYGIYQMVKSDGLSESGRVNSTLISGIIIFVISLFGFCGALRESYCLLITYSIILIILFVIELGYGILLAAGGSDDNIRPVAVQGLDEMFDEFKMNNTKSLDILQKSFECCGINGTSDFELVLGKGILPVSCCEDDDTTSNITKCTTQDKYHEDSCSDMMTNIFTAFIWTQAIICIGTGVLFILGAIIAIILAISIKNHMRRRYP